jgi:hypothetical protein
LVSFVRFSCRFDRQLLASNTGLFYYIFVHPILIGDIQDLYIVQMFRTMPSHQQEAFGTHLYTTIHLLFLCLRSLVLLTHSHK